MLIDLLDKKAKSENALDLLIKRITMDSSITNVNVALAKILLLIDEIRNYDLLIVQEKHKLEVEISNQRFNLLEFDCLVKSIEAKLEVVTTLLSTGHGETNDLIKQYDDLHSDLDTLNKAADEATWRAELGE